MTKFNKEHIRWMEKFRNEGFSCNQISEIIGCDPSSVRYYLDKNYRKNNNERAKNVSLDFTKEERRKNNLKTKKYRREYFYNRYHSDPEFREQLIDLNKTSYRKRIALRIKNNLCVVCGGIRDNERWKLCDKCRKKNRERKRR